MVLKSVRLAHVNFGDLGRCNPLERYDWDGRLVSIDGCPNDDFTGDDVVQIIAVGHDPVDGGGWDGDVAGVLALRDGRYVCYETTWGPTGDGFNRDAYGGTATLNFAWDLDLLVQVGLTDRGRELCGLPNP